MTSEHVPELFALTAEPRSVRAGGTAELTFRARNHGAAPSEPGAVTFAVDDGLTPVDELRIDVDSAAPGQDVVARMRVRAPATCEDRAAFAARAIFTTGTQTFRTNEARIVVRSRPLLDGAGSGTTVEAIDVETVRVRAVVTNTGDGPAHEVDIVAAVPDGCVRVDGAEPAAVRVARIAPGERHELAFDARIVRPMRLIRCDRAGVQWGHGRRAALPVRETLTLEPVLEAPAVALDAGRRRIDATVDVTNVGWVEARDVRVAVDVPPALRVAATAVDSVPCAMVARRTARLAGARGVARRGRDSGAAPVASSEGGRGGCAVTIASIAPRTSARVVVGCVASAAVRDGELRVSVGEHAVRVPVATRCEADLRVVVTSPPEAGVPGSAASVGALIVNGGDAAETVHVRALLEGPASVSGVDPADATAARAHTVAPCSHLRVDVPFSIPGDARADETLPFVVVACDERGERARASASIGVRAVAVPACAETHSPLQHGTGAKRPVDEFTWRPDDIGGAGGSADEPYLDAALRVPERVYEDAAFDVALDILAHAGASRIVVRAGVPSEARYVAGSSRIAGRTMLDDVARADDARGGFTLAGDGIVLGDVAAGTTVSIAWRLVVPAVTRDAAAEGTRSIELQASLDVDGTSRDVAPVRVSVDPRAAFAVHAGELRFGLGGCALAPVDASAPVETSCLAVESRSVQPHVDVAATRAALSGHTSDVLRVHVPAAASAGTPAERTPEESAGAPADAALAETPPAPGVNARSRRAVLRLDAERIDAFRRMQRALLGPGLVAHLFALRFFFPDAVDDASSGADDASHAFARVRSALDDLFDRVYVKLRIPGYGLTADDVDDSDLRDASASLVDGAGGRAVPRMLAALVRLLAAPCEDDRRVAAAIATHADALATTLERYADVPLELFDDALAHCADAALDTARTALVDAIAPHVAGYGATC